MILIVKYGVKNLIAPISLYLLVNIRIRALSGRILACLKGTASFFFATSGLGKDVLNICRREPVNTKQGVEPNMDRMLTDNIRSALWVVS